jgi:hypothetical protein
VPPLTLLYSRAPGAALTLLAHREDARRLVAASAGKGRVRQCGHWLKSGAIHREPTLDTERRQCGSFRPFKRTELSAYIVPEGDLRLGVTAMGLLVRFASCAVNTGGSCMDRTPNRFAVGNRGIIAAWWCVLRTGSA